LRVFESSARFAPNDKHPSLLRSYAALV
jgi:hypothetical protein